MLSIGNGRGKRLPCVFLDVNTQNDFLLPEGACPVTNRDTMVPSLRRIVAWAKRNHVPVVSSVDCHRVGEVRNTRLPLHCVDGTSGQAKVAFTLFGSYVKVEGDNTMAVPADLFRDHQQVIFRKRTSDFFLNPKADRFVTHLPAAEYVVAGLGLEGSVKSIALGLIARNKRVSVVVDASGYFDASEADLALRLLEAKGVNLTTVDELVKRILPRPVRYPLHAIGQVCLRNGLYASISQINGAKQNGNGNGNGKNGHATIRINLLRTKANRTHHP